MRLSSRTTRITLLACLILPIISTSTASAQIVDITAAAGTGANTVAECSIACDPVSGRLIIGAHSDNTLNSKDLSMHLFRSTDGGAHWALTRLGHDYDGLGVRGDPSVAIDDRGTIYMAYTCLTFGEPHAIVCARSTDGGVSFERPTFVYREDFLRVADKPYLTLGRDGDGGLLVLVAFSRMVSGSRAPGLYLAISRDEGRTFDDPVLIHSGPETSYGMATTGPGGEIYVSWIAPGTFRHDVRLTRSVDGGLTFEPSIVLASTRMGFRHTIPAAPHRGIGIVPTIAVDTSPAHPGRVYVSYVTANPNDKADTDICCRWADPAPRLSLFRWSEPVLVHRTDRGSNFHPWLAIEAETGNLAIVSHNTRDDPDRVNVETWLSVSVDGGNRWAERRISESTSDVTGQFGFAPPDYLEYIGVVLSKGVAHCVWAGSGGRYPSVLHYLYRAVPINEIAAGRTISVPGDHSTPAAALVASVAGDHVVLDGREGPFPGPVELVPHVTIDSAPGTLATLDARGAPSAVRLVGKPFSAALNHVRIVGFVSSGVRLETGPVDSIAVSDPVVMPLVRSHLQLTDVTIEGDSVGLASDGVPVQIEGCRFEGMETAVDINLREAPDADATRISRSVFVAASGSASSVAIALRGCTSVDAPLVQRNTIHGWGTGIRVTGASTDENEIFRPLVTRNLITHSIAQPIEMVADPVPPEPVVSRNDFWSPQSGGTPVQEIDNLSVDPRYCGPGTETDDLSLRIDSPLSAGNSPFGPIGALDVLCTPAALEADSRIAPGTDISLNASVVIPAGRTLTIGAGCHLTAGWAHTEDPTQPEPSLIECSGNLIIEGIDLGWVYLEPAAGSAAITVPAGTNAHLDMAGLAVSHGRSALELLGGEGRITGSYFIDQDSVGIRIGAGAGPFDLSRSHVEGAKRAGIGITSPAGPMRLFDLRITECRDAIRLAGSSSTTEDTVEWSSINFDHNDVGLHMLPAPGDASSSCSVGPRLRRNRFDRNVNAIVIEPGANRPDLGRTDPGENWFLNQTGFAVLVGDTACGPVPAFGNRFGDGDRNTAEYPPGSVDWSGWVVEKGRCGSRIFVMPNPSRASVHFQIEMDSDPARVQVDLLDVAGRKIGSLFDARPVGRRFSFDWNGADGTGRRAASGIYWIVVRDNLGNRSVQKIVRVR